MAKKAKPPTRSEVAGGAKAPVAAALLGLLGGGMASPQSRVNEMPFNPNRPTPMVVPKARKGK